ncbi:hypothetical protein AOLI_G00133610 [Acnodon oligacanthus]
MREEEVGWRNVGYHSGRPNSPGTCVIMLLSRTSPEWRTLEAQGGKDAPHPCPARCRTTSGQRLCACAYVDGGVLGRWFLSLWAVYRRPSGAQWVYAIWTTKLTGKSTGEQRK